MKIENMTKGKMRMSSWEYQLSLYIAKVIVIFISIFAGLVRFTALILYRFKQQIYKLALIVMAVNMVMLFQGIAYSPTLTHAANGYAPVAKPVTEHEQIVNYIYEVFGKDSDKAFELLSCENKGLNPNAVNDNTTWGGVGQDIGIFQINNTWQRVQSKFLYNWKINIELAHQLYTENGNFHLWTCGRSLEI